MKVTTLGSSGFGKGGSFDAGNSHGLALAGGMYLSGRWVFFATLINWEKASEFDPATVGGFVEATKEALARVAAGLPKG